MASPLTQYYVDPSIAASTGAGTIGDPYGDLQHALDSITQDTTDGDQINIKAGTAEILTGSLSLTTYGTPSFGYPLIFRGYTAAANDGGVAAIDCQANTAITNAGYCICWVDMELYDGPSTNAILVVAEYGTATRVYVHDSDGAGIWTTAHYGGINACRVEDVGGASYDGILLNSSSYAHNCFIKNGASRAMRNGINVLGARSGNLQNNIISVDGASNGIQCLNAGLPVCIFGNTVLSDVGTGTGIYLSTNALLTASIYNNYVEGFSGTGGVGYDFATASYASGSRGFNAAYNNTTNVTATDETLSILGTDPEILTASGLAKSGADTFANRLAYYAPADTDNMRDGALQPGGEAG
jgi:hypothetical protein